MKQFLLALTFLFSTTALLAQNDYAEKATALQKEVWSDPAPEFKATSVPAQYANESAVILARSYNAQSASTGKFKFMLLASNVTLHTEKISTLHERVKINDKAALESFSTLEYQKKLDKTVSLLFSKLKNTKNTYVGAKIIKPDGKEIIVNTSEEVLTKNQDKDQQGKLAISGLQVGDILDYYISNASVAEKGFTSFYNDNDNVFVLADEYPILYYSIDFIFNKKLTVRHIYANGAPAFEESHDKDGNLLLSVKVRNLPKFQTSLWTSALRQYPYIEIGSAVGDPREDIIGGAKFDAKTAMLQANKKIFEEDFSEAAANFSSFEKGLKNSFGSSKDFKNAPLDSVMEVMYNQWKYKTFDFYYKEDFDDPATINYRRAVSRSNAVNLCFVLNDLKVDFDILLVASRNSNTLDNAFNFDDFDAIIRVNGDKPMYMAFDDAVTHFNEIPERFQGEKAIVLHPTRKNVQRYNFTESEGVVPVSAATDNFVEENLNVSLDANMQKIKIKRDVKKGAGMQHDDQKDLVSTFDIDEAIAEMGRAEGIGTRFKHYQDKDIYINGLNATADKTKADQNKKFTADIKADYDQEPQKVSDCKVVYHGLKDANPVFELSEDFMLDNMVKKAGANYIVDAGHLTGNFLKLDEKDRTRTLDVYMPVARSFKYTIALTIPPGFNVQGVPELNVKKVNKTGSFTSVATLNGNTLTITVSRVYNNNFEKAADWPLLVDLIQTASDFNGKKILLEKKG